MSGSPIEAPSSAPAMVTVPVYYVLRTPQGPRLVQEPTPVPAANKVAGAAQALLQAPKDPDYTSFYHAGDLGDAHYDGTAFTAVETNPAIARAGTLSKADAALAVQQLVYTLEAAQGTSDAPVKVIADGASTPLFGVPTAAGVKPASQLRTLADINLLTPAEGSTQAGSLLASGLANSPEANVIWKITDAHGTVVKHGYATAAGWMDKLYPWRKKIDISGLPAGDYTLTASTDNEADGEGPGATSDTKAFTVS